MEVDPIKLFIMKIFPAASVQEIDRYTIEHEPVQSVNLMERAASRIVDWYVRHYKTERKVIILAGPGNNGGDALAVARMLITRQYRVECYLVGSLDKLSKDCRINYDRLQEMNDQWPVNLQSASDFPPINASDVIIDGLFGSGLSRPVGGLFGELIKYANTTDAKKVSIDIPSGLFGEDNSANTRESIFCADVTLTFQFPFLSFFFAENAIYTGRWKVLDIGLHPVKIIETHSDYSVIMRKDLAALLPSRQTFAHKGVFGHALIIAGSYGMTGAAILAGKAGVRGGAGLVTVHLPSSAYEIMQISVPEVIVSVDSNDKYFTVVPELKKYNAIAIGPGLGNQGNSMEAIEALFDEIDVPLVIDADALNMMALNPSLLEKLPQGSVLTPHPGEFDRLAGKSESGWERHLKQIEFSRKYKVIVVLKGAYTGISFPEGNYVFNSTGNPGMATGGSGDVLTGLIVSLLAQGMTPEKAAIAGVFIHGKAGDLAAEKCGLEALIASDIIKYLGAAFNEVKANPFLHEGRNGGIIQ